MCIYNAGTLKYAQWKRHSNDKNINFVCYSFTQKFLKLEIYNTVLCKSNANVFRRISELFGENCQVSLNIPVYLCMVVIETGTNAVVIETRSSSMVKIINMVAVETFNMIVTKTINMVVIVTIKHSCHRNHWASCHIQSLHYRAKKKGKAAAAAAASACKVSSSAVSRQLELHVQAACLFRANLPSESVCLVTSKKW